MLGLAHCGRRSDKKVEARVCTLAALVAAGLALSASAYAFEPNRGVTIVVTTSAGGGNDVISRTLATVIKELNLTGI